ncbi:MAG: MetQ/NlpA family ABC transporter substrate-binding protein [Aerococcus sp.]|nr:MetQ/NlpA family ABC transporter substrate-binding protein [Aerococcus sp.]
MKKKHTHLILSLLLVAALIFLSACGLKKDNTADKASSDADLRGKTFTVGTSGDFDRQIWEDVGKRLKEKKGINLKTMGFSEFIQPDRALQEGTIDANSYQYTPFLYETSKNWDLDLVPIGYAQMTPIGIWAPKSKPLKSLKDVKDGMKLAIGRDPVVLDNELRQLEKAGLITMPKDTSKMYTIDDIQSNPHHLKFQEVDSASMMSFVDDSDIFVTHASVAGLADYKPEEALYLEDPKKMSDDFKLVFAVRRDRKDDPLVKAVLDEYQTEDTKKIMDKVTHGMFLPAWNDKDREADNKHAYEHFEELKKKRDKEAESSKDSSKQSESKQDESKSESK